MPTSDRVKISISNMLDANGYRFRDNSMPGDDFRLFLTPPGLDAEIEEVFKFKGSDKVFCAAQIIIGGEVRDAFYKQDKEIRGKFKEMVKSVQGVKDLNFFEVADDGKDFLISIRVEITIDKLFEDMFADAMNRLNIAGGHIEDLINMYFDNLIHTKT